MIEVGTKVKAVEVCDSKRVVKFEQGVVIYVGRRVLVEFYVNVCGHDGNGLGKARHCWMMDWDKVREVSV